MKIHSGWHFACCRPGAYGGATMENTISPPLFRKLLAVGDLLHLLCQKCVARVKKDDSNE